MTQPTASTSAGGAQVGGNIFNTRNILLSLQVTCLMFSPCAGSAVCSIMSRKITLKGEKLYTVGLIKS